MAKIYRIGQERYALVLDAGVAQGSRASMGRVLRDAGILLLEALELFEELEADPDVEAGAFVALPGNCGLAFLWGPTVPLELEDCPSWDTG